LSSCSDDENNTTVFFEEPLAYYEEQNVSYGSEEDQVFDIYLPANRDLDTKVIILVHGGGWIGGDKNDMNGFKDFIRDELPNMAIVNINYRLASEGVSPFPMQIDDITAVINHLKANANSYSISDTYGFIGTSAGAHLSLLWSYAFDLENNIDMVASIVGPTNFTDPAYTDNPLFPFDAILNIFGEDASPEFLMEISPYHNATVTSPPTILFYGGIDPLIPTSQGTGMRDKLQELGVTHEFTLYPFAGHGWVGPDLFDTSVKLKTFIETHLY
jgi:acetyl esterase/lipase